MTRLCDRLLRRIKKISFISRASMYELMILSILMRGTAHGYLIASIINDIIRPYARLSNGRLYPLLSKLKELGMIVAIKKTGKNVKGDRNLRGYEITDAGRERFHELMMDTTSNPGEYRQIFLQKVSVLRFLKPAERLPDRPLYQLLSGAYLASHCRKGRPRGSQRL